MARQYTCMTEVAWRELMKGNEHKFAVNEVLNQLGDLRLMGEVNHFCNYAKEQNILDCTLRKAQCYVSTRRLPDLGDVVLRISLVRTTSAYFKQRRASKQ